MKKILFIAIALFGIIPISAKVLAQTKIIPGRLESKIQSPFTDRLELKGNLRTDFHPEKNFIVEVMIENNMEKGNMVKFKASDKVEKVVISAFDKMNELIASSTTNYSGGTTNGVFFLDAPSYAGRKFYVLTFFVQGLPDQVWSTMVERKKPLIIQHKIPKKIPN